ncbi:MAG: L,D-transpeptidase family protein [Chitinivibrionales bacterium]|nr:L,D-transpeptidase family protein [Chitinivibrionales bacterium]
MGIHAMWRSLERTLSYYGKAIQFRMETWHKKREIARAYHHTPLLQRVQRYARPAAIAVLIAATAVALYAFVPALFSTLGTMLKNRPATARKAIPRAPKKSRPAATAPQPGEKSKPDEIPEFTPGPELNSEFALIANKATRNMHLLRQKDSAQWKPIQEYSIAVGERQGRKERAGDKKTPEGIYFITGRKEASELPEIYGPLAYVLNYPNEEDKKAGRNGEGIWIHGTSPDSFPLQTRGCLELNNKDLTELSSYLKLGIGTPVIIINEPSPQNPAATLKRARLARKHRSFISEHAQRQKDFRRLLSSWESAWESQNIDQYSRFYDTTGFYGQGLQWNDWKQRKIRTFQNYNSIALNIQDIRVTDFSESTAVVKFIQRYTSDALDVMNGKKISLIKKGGTWKIKQESTFPREEHLS